ncbi:MAG: metal ABC transporter permease [Pseudomonadota bacterium]
MDLATFLQIDLPAMLVGTLAALCCALPGNFLLLRRQALMGDALSHVVLPGIVIGFLVTGSQRSDAMLVGAGVAALLSVGLIEIVRRLGRVESGAAMGIVFATMFALGLLLLEQSGARAVHIDVQHALYGNIEGTVWLGATGWGSLVDPGILADIPPTIPRLAGILVIIALVMILLFKELRLCTFDPALASSLGFRPGLVSVVLLGLVAIAAVAAFDAVGSVLVVAMFVCPPATARMLTDRLRPQVWISLAVAAVSALLGYGVAAAAPSLFGVPSALSAAGMIVVVAGLLQAVAMIFAPRHGVVGRFLARRRVARDMSSLPPGPSAAV